MDVSLIKKERTMEATTNSQQPTFAPWRLTGIGLLRILFGVVWGIDAWFK
jgi:hypothetical protein